MKSESEAPYQYIHHMKHHDMGLSVRFHPQAEQLCIPIVLWRPVR